jgi:hypothetical protein
MANEFVLRRPPGLPKSLPVDLKLESKTGTLAHWSENVEMGEML